MPTLEYPRFPAQQFAIRHEKTGFDLNNLDRPAVNVSGKAEAVSEREKCEYNISREIELWPAFFRSIRVQRLPE